MQKAISSTEDQEKQQDDDQDLQGEAEPASELVQDSININTPTQESQPLQFVDIEGRPTGAYK